jgi:hypothetical protein
MDGTRASERADLRGEYPDGGLEYIQEQVNLCHEPANLVVSAWSPKLARSGAVEGISLRGLLGVVSW